MRLGVLCETAPREKRVALIPDDVAKLCGLGFEVSVQVGAGVAAGFMDDDYSAAGASVGALDAVLAADAVLTVRDGQTDNTPSQGSGKLFAGVFDPRWDATSANLLAKRDLTSFSMDLVPRITRAQSMDVLSSMATVAGYQAVLLAASHLPQMFPLMMTAAGTLKPARVLVLGAGVAGLQAIATARKLGGVVEAYDVRPAAQEQIRSMGAKAVELDLSAAEGDAGGEGSGGYARAQGEDAAELQRQQLTPHIAASDVVISTAAVPGRASPLLISSQMVAAMKPASVIIDLAAERGGNCELTQADEQVDSGGVTILGPTDLPSRAARHASQMFSHNLTEFLGHLAPEGSSALDQLLEDEDEIIKAMLVTHGGKVVGPESS